MKGLKARYILLSADTYRIVNDSTGEVNEGITTWYLMDDELAHQQNQARGNGVSLGIKPSQASFPIDALPNIKSVPGVYEFTLAMTSVKDQDTKRMIQAVKPTHLEYVGDISLTVTKPKAQ